MYRLFSPVWHVCTLDNLMTQVTTFMDGLLTPYAAFNGSLILRKVTHRSRNDALSQEPLRDVLRPQSRRRIALSR